MQHYVMLFYAMRCHAILCCPSRQIAREGGMERPSSSLSQSLVSLLGWICVVHIISVLANPSCLVVFALPCSALLGYGPRRAASAAQLVDCEPGSFPFRKTKLWGDFRHNSQFSWCETSLEVAQPGIKLTDERPPFVSIRSLGILVFTLSSCQRVRCSGASAAAMARP